MQNDHWHKVERRLSDSAGDSTKNADAAGTGRKERCLYGHGRHKVLFF